MFKERMRLRQLKAEVKRTEELYAPDFRAAKTEEDYQAVRGEYDAVAADAICALEGLKTLRLRRKAAKFGIEIPPFEEYWDEYPFSRVTYLSDRGTTLVNRSITDARFAYWKRWVEIIAPTASVIISLLALVLAGLALYLQFKGAGSNSVP